MDVAVRDGEFVAVLGANGSGKSTLLKAVLGALATRRGRGQRAGAAGGTGKRGDRLPAAAALVRFGHAAARAATWCGWASTATAGGCRCRSGRGKAAALATAAGAEARIEEVIELVGAGEYAERPIGELSGGEQQRLLIAQALVRRPKLLLLDEPLDSLDLPNQAVVAALVHEICRRRGRGGAAGRPRRQPAAALSGQGRVPGGGHAVAGPVEQVITGETLRGLYGVPVEVLSAATGGWSSWASPRRRPIITTAIPTTTAGHGDDACALTRT